MSREKGIPEAQLQALADFETSDAFDELELATLRVADAMCENPVVVPEDAMAVLHEHLGPPQVVELVAQLAWEQFRARFNRTLGVESDDLSRGAYLPPALD